MSIMPSGAAAPAGPGTCSCAAGNSTTRSAGVPTVRRAVGAADLALVLGREHDGLEARVEGPERDADVAPAVAALSGTSGAVVTYWVRGSGGTTTLNSARERKPLTWADSMAFIRGPKVRKSVPLEEEPHDEAADRVHRA